ncbi:MAG: YggS family pyridoxal phosphate-dependent enzyme [Saprospiraceae bacterium]|nr:YggS family pyridoxal phosphate-dependent enzyme [Saprospiraceae bacterium]
MFNDVKTYTEAHHVRLVAVTKTRSVDDILKLYQAGQRDMGENRVQELLAKKEQLPADIQWHLIGHLQSNKVKSIAPFIHLIHSVDSLELYQTINKEAKKAGRVIDVLLQFYIATEETKFGLDYREALEIISFHKNNTENFVRIVGVMGMASLTENETQIRKEFSKLKTYFDQLKEQFFANDSNFREISMGMSSDYKTAIEEGSTMVRVGSLLFR